MSSQDLFGIIRLLSSFIIIILILVQKRTEFLSNDLNKNVFNFSNMKKRSFWINLFFSLFFFISHILI